MYVVLTVIRYRCESSVFRMTLRFEIYFLINTFKDLTLLIAVNIVYENGFRP